jgi:hypothetical protein
MIWEEGKLMGFRPEDPASRLQIPFMHSGERI